MKQYVSQIPGSLLWQLDYFYDTFGNRIEKRYTTYNGIQPGTTKSTFYVRDAQGNVMSTYTWEDNDELKLEEQVIYGSKRMGVVNSDRLLFSNIDGEVTMQIPPYNHYLGRKQYELTNHLGNVMATISDQAIGVDNTADGVVDYYEPAILSAQDYYAFGMMMPGRTLHNKIYGYGFNGQEKEVEIEGTGNIYTAAFWEYDARLGRRWNIDPAFKAKPWMAPYHAFSNKPILNIDPNGANDDEYNAVYNKNTGNYDKTKISSKYGEAVDLIHYKGGALNGQHMVFNNFSLTATWFGGSNLGKGSTSKTLAASAAIVGAVDQTYSAWQNELNFKTYTTTKGKTALILDGNGVRSAKAAKQLNINNSVKLGGVGLNIVTTGLGYALLYDQYRVTHTINPIDFTEVGVGTTGTIATGMSYLGWGGAAAGAVGSTTGLIGIGIQSGKIWYGMYRSMQDLELQNEISTEPGEVQWNQWKYSNGVLNEGDLYGGQ